MPLEALATSTSVATLAAGLRSICALLAIELYSRRERQVHDAHRTLRAPWRDDPGIPAAGIWLVYQLAPVVCGRLLHLLLVDLHVHFRSAAVRSEERRGGK